MRKGAPRLPLRVIVRAVGMVPVIAGLSVIGAATRLGPPMAGCALASTVHHAAFLAEHADGSVVARCVTFSSDAITGEQLLSLAGSQGVEYATAGYGATGRAVCQVDNEPASYPSTCWTASSPYWAMFVSRAGGGWTYSSLGISAQTFHDGDAEGFRYESQSAGTVPVSAAGVCPPPPSPTPTPARSVPSAARAAATARAPVPPPAASTRSVAGASGLPAAASASSSPDGSSRSSAGEGATSPGAVLSTNPASARPLAGAGTWAAVALGAALVAALVTQTARSRRRSQAPRR